MIPKFCIWTSASAGQERVRRDRVPSPPSLGAKMLFSVGYGGCAPQMFLAVGFAVEISKQRDLGEIDDSAGSHGFHCALLFCGKIPLETWRGWCARDAHGPRRTSEWSL